MCSERKRAAGALMPAALVMLCLFTCALGLSAQDPANSSDHPAGNVNELTLAGLQPGLSRIRVALARFGPRWQHPSADETDLYVWCDARAGLQLSLEVNPDGTIQVVTVNRRLSSATAATCSAQLPPTVARTSRGVRLDDTEVRLKQVYGKPFFEGPSSWDGRNVNLVVFNFSWAGTDKPQILESSFDSQGRLVKMTLSAEYY